jgi:ribosomal protein L27
MATKLTKPVSREIDGLIVTLTAGGIVTREKGTRTAYGPVGYRRIHTIGAKDLADGELAAKRVKRKRTSSLKVGI